MGITNKALDEKLDKIYAYIDDLFNESKKNQIAVVEIKGKIGQLVDHVTLQNGRIGKCESGISGIESQTVENEKVVQEVYDKQESCLERHRKETEAVEKRADRLESFMSAKKLAVFGGGISIVTGIIVGVVILIAKSFGL